MRKRVAEYVCAVTALLTLLSAPAFPQVSADAKTTRTAKAKKPVVVVSMGDSYSAGEGIEPFYGQYDNWEDNSYEYKVNCRDWLAHRSTDSWPGRLKIPGVSGTLSDYKVTGENQSKSDKCRWYFAASSGAETIHFYESQRKDFNIFLQEIQLPPDKEYGMNQRRAVPLYLKSEKPESAGKYLERDGKKFYAVGYGNYITELNLVIDNDQKDLPRQLDIFDTVKANGDTVDYVTMSIGGNDVGFANIVGCCATNSSYLDFGSKKIDEMIKDIWDDWDDCYRPNIKGVYDSVLRHINDDAYLIVAGYPKLFEQSGKGFLISEYEAATVNKNVSKFNYNISKLVDSMNNPHVVFVGVEDEFDGHEAYSDDPWMNDIMIIANSEDLNSDNPSSYSMHPNSRGAQAYADCVNAAIAEIEDKKTKQVEKKVVYGIKGAEWIVDPTIEADDIIVGDHYNASSGGEICPYVYIKRSGKYGFIDYDGNIAVEPVYDSFNGDKFYGLDDFLAVYDSKSGDTIFVDYGGPDSSNKWSITKREKAFGQPGIGTTMTTYFIDENDGEFYRYTIPGDDQPEAIIDGPDTSYVVQKINYVPSKWGIGDSSASDEKFYLYNDIKGETLTDGYKYVYANGHGSCTWSGYNGYRQIKDGFTTVAFSNNKKKWDIYDSVGELIASDLEPFDCNLDMTPWWSPATALFNDSDSYDSAKNTHGRKVPFCATEGYIAAKIDGKYGYLDLDGNAVIEFGILDDVRPVHNGKAWAKFEGKWGVLSFDTQD